MNLAECLLRGGQIHRLPMPTRQSLVAIATRGKSGLHRAECQVTPGRRLSDDAVTASATENKPPCLQGKGEKVR